VLAGGVGASQKNIFGAPTEDAKASSAFFHVYNFFWATAFLFL